MKSQVLLTGLLIMADWIASNTYYFPLIESDKVSLGSFNESLKNHKVRVTNAWKKLSLPHIWCPGLLSIDSSEFNNTFGFMPNNVQKTILDVIENSDNPGIFILESQMGSGKTEAALAAAELLAGKCGCGGLFFGLPTQATANAIFSRMKPWAESQSESAVHAIRLAHGMAEMNDDYQDLFLGNSNTNDEDENKTGNLVIHSWFKGRKQALLANFVIGTIDQFLMAALKQKHVMLRHLGLAGKIVIVDECHAYDAYMNQFLDRSLNWLGVYNVPVILLSATLPARRRTELINSYLNKRGAHDVENDEWKTAKSYPILTWTDGQSVSQKSIISQSDKHKINVGFLSDENISGYLKTKLLYGGCAGIIVNTVGRSQKLAKKIKCDFPDFDVLLFHSQFIMPDRAHKETELIQRIGKQSTPLSRKNVIVIGTQVLEQSLDIDFDVLITDLCPMDLLLQRMGRLQRHKRERPENLKDAECIIIENEESVKIYTGWLLTKTRQLIPEYVTLPDDIPSLIQHTYDEPDINMLNSDMKKLW